MRAPILRRHRSASLLERIQRLPRAHSRAVVERLDTVTRTLWPSLPHARGTADGTLGAALEALSGAGQSEVWLTLAVVSGRLPDAISTEAAARAVVLDGPGAAVDAALDNLDLAAEPLPVRVAVGETLVDLNNTVQTPIFTGIQRVARESARSWANTHDVTLISWNADLSCPRSLTDAETRKIMGLPAGTATESDAPRPPYELVVPWHSRYLLPELAAERPRTSRQLAMARFTTTTVSVIGYDTVPLTSGETSIAGLPGEFAGYLAAARHYDKIATISEAAAVEYRGWRTMLGGTGMTGPEIKPIMLAAESPEPLPRDVDGLRGRLLLADLPMILCVGTHEPRKNHLGVLHAAEVLWRAGHRFSLTFIGGHAWNSDEFDRTLLALQAANRPVETMSGIGDTTLHAAYRLARFTVFPSFNEGFGLPVAESLAAGTPVITSGYGSMREIADDGGGALLVDPRDDHDLAAAMATLLTDDVVYARLRDEAAARTTRHWQDYAADLWTYFTTAPTPDQP